MHFPFPSAMSAFKRKFLHEDAQDLVEYSLTFAVVAFGCVAGVGSVAQAIDQTFAAVTTVLSAAV